MVFLLHGRFGTFRFMCLEAFEPHLVFLLQTEQLEVIPQPMTFCYFQSILQFSNNITIQISQVTQVLSGFEILGYLPSDPHIYRSLACYEKITQTLPQTSPLVAPLEHRLVTDLVSEASTRQLLHRPGHLAPSSGAHSMNSMILYPCGLAEVYLLLILFI